MRIPLLFILTISTLQVAGQNHLIGVKGGLNSTNITSSNFIRKTDTKTGLTAGLTFEYLFKEHFSLGVDVIYNQRGFTNNLVLTDNSGNPTGERHTSTFNCDYISLPLKTGFHIGTKLYGFTTIGAVPSLLHNAQTTTPTFDKEANFIGNETFDITNRVSTFDLAGQIEIGGGYNLNERYRLFTSFSYQQSLTSITNSDYFEDSEIRHNGMSLTIGVKCALTKESLSKTTPAKN